MTTRRRRGEDGISFEHRGPCRDPQRHRHCPGLWRGEITLGYTGDGKRTRRKVSGATKAAVIDKLRDLHHQLDTGITPKPGYTHYTVRQAAYDLRKLRGKNLAAKPGRSRRYQTTPDAARTITALLTLRDHVIAPILAGVRSPRIGRKPAHWTDIDRDYETLRIGMQALLRDLAIETPSAA